MKGWLSKARRPHIGGRHVRTYEGSKVFGKPIGALITTRDIMRARAAGKLGGTKDHETRSPTNRGGAVGTGGVRVKERFRRFDVAIGGAKDAKMLHAIRAQLNADPVFPQHRKDTLNAKIDQALKGKGQAPAPKAPVAGKKTAAAAARKPAGMEQRIAQERAAQQRQPSNALVAPPKAPAKPAPARKPPAPAKPQGMPPAARDKAKERSANPPKVTSTSPTIGNTPKAHRGGGPKRPEFTKLVADAKSDEDLAGVMDLIDAHEIHMTDDEVNDVVNQVQDRYEALKRGGPAAPDVIQQRNFMGHLDNIHISPTASLKRVKAGIENDHTLSPEQKKTLLDLIDDKVGSAAKPKRSPAYDILAQDLHDEVGTRADGLIWRDQMLQHVKHAGERKSLMTQLHAQLRALGIDPASLDDPSIDFGDPNVGRGWDTLPDKMKPPTAPAPTGRQKKMIQSPRPQVDGGIQVRMENQRRRNVESLPAAQELRAGKRLSEVQNVDGMVEYIESHPERFDLNAARGGQGTAFSVFDKDHNEHAFFKQTLNGHENSNGEAVGMSGEATNEVVSAEIGHGAFPEWFVQTDYASSLNNELPPILRSEHMLDKYPDPNDFVQFSATDRWDMGPYGDQLEHATILPGEPPATDPKNPLAIHIFDFLTNNTDRHQENYAVVKKDNGDVVFVAFDNGAAFHGFDSFVDTLGGRRPQGGMLPAHFTDDPASVGYAEWGLFYGDPEEMWSRPRTMVLEAQKAYEARQADAAKIAADAEEILARFRKTDVRKLIQAQVSRTGATSDYDRAHLDEAARIFESRLQNITGADIAKIVEGMK